MLYLGVSDTHEAQLQHPRRANAQVPARPQGSTLRLVAERCPFNYTGADFLRALLRRDAQCDVSQSRGDRGENSCVYSSPHPCGRRLKQVEFRGAERAAGSVRTTLTR